MSRMKELSPDEWANLFDNEGRITDEAALRKRIFYGVERLLVYH